VACSGPCPGENGGATPLQEAFRPEEEGLREAKRLSGKSQCDAMTLQAAPVGPACGVPPARGAAALGRCAPKPWSPLAAGVSPFRALRARRWLIATQPTT
jgi:hypothetical protein